MKFLPVLVFTTGALVLSLHANAQSATQKVELKDLGVSPAQNNPNVINEPVRPAPPSAPASPAVQKINSALSQPTNNGFGGKIIGSPGEGSRGGGAAATYNYGGSDSKPKSTGAKAVAQ